MASRAVKPNVASLQNNMQLIAGTVTMTGPYGGVSSSLSVTAGGIGLVPFVASGSSPTQFVTQGPVVWLGSGSLALILKDLYPQLLSSLLTLGLDATSSLGPVGDIDWTCGNNSGISTYNSTLASAAGVTGSAAPVNQIPIFLAKSGSLADPVAGETVNIHFLLNLANTTLTYPGGI